MNQMIIIAMTLEEAKAYVDCAEVGLEGHGGGSDEAAAAGRADQKMRAAIAQVESAVKDMVICEVCNLLISEADIREYRGSYNTAEAPGTCTDCAERTKS